MECPRCQCTTFWSNGVSKDKYITRKRYKCSNCKKVIYEVLGVHAEKPVSVVAPPKPVKPRKFKCCEFCGGKLMMGHRSKNDATTCEACDTDLDIKYEAKQLFRLWKFSHRKCRKCKGPLPLTRFFKCEDCMPNDRWTADDGCVYA